MPTIDRFEFSDVDIWAMKLSKAGYGTVDEIKHTDIQTFLNMIYYENFCSEYKEATIALNRKD